MLTFPHVHVYRLHHLHFSTCTCLSTTSSTCTCKVNIHNMLFGLQVGPCQHVMPLHFIHNYTYQTNHLQRAVYFSRILYTQCTRIMYNMQYYCVSALASYKVNSAHHRPDTSMMGRPCTLLVLSWSVYTTGMGLVMYVNCVMDTSAEL